MTQGNRGFNILNMLSSALEFSPESVCRVSESEFLFPLDIRIDIHKVQIEAKYLMDKWPTIRWPHDIMKQLSPIETFHPGGEHFGWVLQGKGTDASSSFIPYVPFPNEVFEKPGQTHNHVLPIVPPYLKKIISFFDGANKSSLTGISPGFFYCLHADPDRNTAKIHIPIETNEDCYCYNVDGYLNMPVGDRPWVWMTDSPHFACNTGATDRIHLIIQVPVEILDDLKSLKGVVL